MTPAAFTAASASTQKFGQLPLLSPLAPSTAPKSDGHRRAESMRVALAFVENRVNVWLRFGKPQREAVLDRWRRVALFSPGAICCRVKWIGNEFGTALWQLAVLQAPQVADGMQSLAGVVPGALILLRAQGEAQVKSVLELVDGIEGQGMDPCEVGETYWRTVGNRLVANQALPMYSAERHAAKLGRGLMQ